MQSFVLKKFIKMVFEQKSKKSFLFKDRFFDFFRKKNLLMLQYLNNQFTSFYAYRIAVAKVDRDNDRDQDVTVRGSQR